MSSIHTKPHKLTTENLIKGCKEGQKEYQKALVQRYAKRLLTVSRRYARHEMEAEDILQDGFIVIFQNIKNFQSRAKGSFEAWMRKIIISCALKIYNRHSFKKEQIGIQASQETIALEPDVYAHLSAEELMQIIRQLPDGYRQVFNLSVIEGFSHKEIAKLLDIAESSSRSQLTRAKKMLKQQITQLQRNHHVKG